MFYVNGLLLTWLNHTCWQLAYMLHHHMDQLLGIMKICKGIITRACKEVTMHNHQIENICAGHGKMARVLTNTPGFTEMSLRWSQLLGKGQPCPMSSASVAEWDSLHVTFNSQFVMESSRTRSCCQEAWQELLVITLNVNCMPSKFSYVKFDL